MTQPSQSPTDKPGIYPDRIPKPSNRARWREEMLTIEPDKFSTAMLAAAWNNMPWVREKDFISTVIPIISKPFVPENRAKYLAFIKDHSFFLKVVDDNDTSKVLHAVPPLWRQPRTTIPQLDGGLSVADVLLSLQRYRDLNQIAEMDDTIQDYLDSITHLPDMIEDILLPLDRILRQYGVTLDVSTDGSRATETPSLVKQEKGGTPAPLSCFTEEEDEY